MAITKVINDAVDLNQTSDYSGLRLPVGTTSDVVETFTTDYLVVGGGGGGARGYAGGGGAGGLRTSYNNSTTTTNSLSFPSGKTAIATYMLDNNATDISGNYNGTEVNITYNTGEYGGAAVFNGSSSYINLGSTIDDPLRTSGEFGVSLWANTNSYTSNSPIIKLLNDIYLLILYNSSNEIECRVLNSSGVLSTITHSVSLNTWCHIVWTGNSTNGVTLYLNGSSVGNAAWNGTFFTYTNTNYKLNTLGYNGAGAGYYDGKIDQVRIYNTALSSTDVSNIYNNEVQANSGGGTAAEPSLTLTEGVAYNVTVGQGGAGVTGNGVSGSGANGQNSIFSVITSNGGGGGGDYNNNSPGVQNGGSGGGGGAEDAGGVSGNGTINQGYNGGVGSTTGIYRGGGGGGAEGVGINGSTSGNGGSAVSINIIGSATAYAGGGGGGLYSVSSGNAGSGGSNIGGDGAKGAVNAESGTNNTGSGGGSAGGVGNGYNGGGNAGDGGSGVVILRYPTASVSSFTATGTLNTPSTTDTLASATYPATNAAYYKLDGNATDSSGNGYNGNDSNVTWVNGRFNKAARFNGSSSKIDLPNILPANSNADSSFTCWFNTSDTSGNQQTIVNAWNGSTTANNGGYALFKDAGNVLRLGNYYLNSTASGVDGSTNVGDGNWHFVAIVFDYSAGTLKVFLDDNSTPEITINSLTPNTVNPFNGGAELGYQKQGGPFRYWNGDIDQIRIFPTALTLSNITDLYNEHYQTKFTDGSDTAIVFTEGTGTVAFSGTNPTPPQGALRTNTSYSEDGSASVIEHYNGTDWKYFDAIKYCTTNTLNFPSGAGCVASYNLNNNVNDIGNTYSGANNNVTFNASGKFGAAGVFNGSNAFVDSGFTALSSTEASISFWVNIAAYTNYGGFVGDSTGQSSQSRFFLGQGSGTSGNLWVSLGNGSTQWYDDTTVSLSSYGLNTWFHLVGTVNGTSVKIYINGSLIHTFTSSISYAGAGTFPYYFGGWAGALLLNGELDQIRFFTTALTLAQVKDLYNNEIACS